jgi:hypothetical protein
MYLDSPTQDQIRRSGPTYLYECYTKNGVLLYAGCAQNPFWTHGTKPTWLAECKTITLTLYPSRTEALIAKYKLFQD